MSVLEVANTVFNLAVFGAVVVLGVKTRRNIKNRRRGQ